MSASTPAHREKKRHSLWHHARRPYGIIIIVGILFVAAWATWTFVIW